MKTQVCTLAMLLAMSAACTDKFKADADAEKDLALKEVTQDYLTKVVYPTYTALTDTSELLVQSLITLKDTRTDAAATAAAQLWKQSRRWWELSEAFLYGPASDYGIDPHIDTWPIGLDELTPILADNAVITSMSAANGDIYAGNNNGDGLLGYHAIEYILFRNGDVRSASSITDDELTFAIAVAGDLRNQCYRLQAGWQGVDALSNAKQSKITAMQLPDQMPARANSYGTLMSTAGDGNNLYHSYTEAAVQIVEGCLDIIDEVGEVKISTPVLEGDANHIESPYANNSLKDFMDNLRGVENAYLGGTNSSERNKSISSYVRTKNQALDDAVRAALTDAIAKIGAIGEPFVDHLSAPACQVAIDACAVVSDKFNDVKKLLEEE